MSAEEPSEKDRLEGLARILRDHYLEDRQTARESKWYILSVLAPATILSIFALKTEALDINRTYAEYAIILIALVAAFGLITRSNARLVRSARIAARTAVIERMSQTGSGIPLSDLREEVALRLRGTQAEAAVAIGAYLGRSRRAVLRAERTPADNELLPPPRSPWLDQVLRQRKAILAAAIRLDKNAITKEIRLDLATKVNISEFGMGFLFLAVASLFFAQVAFNKMLETLPPLENRILAASGIALFIHFLFLFVFSSIVHPYSVGKNKAHIPPHVISDSVCSRELTWIRWSNVTRFGFVVIVAAVVLWQSSSLPIGTLLGSAFVFSIASFALSVARQRLGTRIVFLSLQKNPNTDLVGDELVGLLESALGLRVEEARRLAVTAVEEAHRLFELRILEKKPLRATPDTEEEPQPHRSDDLQSAPS